MPTRRAEAHWFGNALSGQGRLEMGELPPSLDYSLDARLRHGRGISPETFLGASLASCYAMALAHGLDQQGYWPKHIHVTAKVHLDETRDRQFQISRIDVDTEGDVPEIGLPGFILHAERAVHQCPIGAALRAIPMDVHATLIGEDPPRHGD